YIRLNNYSNTNTYMARNHTITSNLPYSFASYFLMLSVLVSCSKNDDETEIINADPFYEDALTSADKNALLGTWSIYAVAYDGQSGAVTSDFPQCDRDYFTFTSDNFYKEYLFANYLCEPEINTLTWSLKNGVLTLSNYSLQSEELVITKLSSTVLVFKAKADVDGDDEADIITLSARKYEPKGIDAISSTFRRNTNDEYKDKIRLEWNMYQGDQNFKKYEIYRSLEGCDKENAELLASINDINTLYIVDDNPPLQETICYFFKIYTDKGLLGESDLLTLNTWTFAVHAVEQLQPTVTSDNIELNWTKYDGNFFSHYEIVLQNYFDGSGFLYQDEILATIDDVNTTTFTDYAPPYFKNPIYSIVVYDIFGNRSELNNEIVKSSREAIYKRPEILELENVFSITIDDQNPILYFLGLDDYGILVIDKYNYSTKTIEPRSLKPDTGINNLDVQLVKSSHGREIAILSGYNTIDVYNAENIEFKYTLSPEEVPVINDFTYIGENIWAITNKDYIYLYKRENRNFELLDKKAHFKTPHYEYNNYILKLDESSLLVGNYAENQSILFTIRSSGNLSEGELKNIPLRAKKDGDVIYNNLKKYAINLSENKIYDTENYSFLRSYPSPYNATSINNQGTIMYGSNNDPEWYYTNSPYTKEVQAYKLITNEAVTFESKGYPHFVFENYLGQIISVSSGLKRPDFYSSVPRQDIFVEIIE
ncbi:MAG: lipocalin family protein, partial [Leeuwenhoekiella sp.]